jgi:hypothetical protein
MSKIQFDFAVKRLYLNSFSNAGRARRSSGDFIVPFASEWFVHTTPTSARNKTNRSSEL